MVKMQIYMVKLDWSTEDDRDMDIYLYSTYEKAYQKFKELIKYKMNAENSWVGEIKWNGNLPEKRYEFNYLERRNNTNETECYWLITDTWNYKTYTYITVEIKEVDI